MVARARSRGGLILCLLCLVVLAHALHDRFGFGVNAVVERVQANPSEALLPFIGIYVVGVLTAIPTLPLNLASGLIWGPLVGGLVATVSSSLGAAAAFLATRTTVGPAIRRRLSEKIVQGVSRAVPVSSWEAVALLRLNPLFPTGVVNYALGFTAIPVLTYLWSTVIFLLPPSVAVAWIGSEMGVFVQGGGSGAYLSSVMGVSGAASLLLALRIGGRYFATRRGAEQCERPSSL